MRAQTIGAATLTAVFLMTGCIADEQNEDATGPADPLTADATVRLAAGEHLSWSATLEGDAALRFRIAPESTAVCTVTWSYKDDVAGPGWDAFMVLEWGDESTWTVFGNHRAQVQARAAGLVDAGDYVRPARYDDRIDIRWRAWTVAEPTWYTMAASGLADVEDAPPNLALDIVCDAPVTVDDWHAGREFTLFEAWKTEGGVAAGVDYVPIVSGANVAAADSVEAEFAAPEVRFYLQEAHASEGRLDLAHPAGTQSYPFQSRIVDDAPFHTVVDGAGAYRVDATEVGYFGQGYWGALVGLEPVAGPEDLTRLRAGHAHPCPQLCL